MADETPNSTPDTEPNDTDPAVAYQPPPTVVTLYDRGGREHQTAPSSKFAVDGLADGTLAEQPPAQDGDQQSPEGVSDGPEAGSGGDDPKPGNTDGNDGSGDGTADTGGSGRRRRAGTA